MSVLFFKKKTMTDSTTTEDNTPLYPKLIGPVATLEQRYLQVLAERDYLRQVAKTLASNLRQTVDSAKAHMEMILDTTRKELVHIKEHAQATLEIEQSRVSDLKNELDTVRAEFSDYKDKSQTLLEQAQTRESEKDAAISELCDKLAVLERQVSDCTRTRATPAIITNCATSDSEENNEAVHAASEERYSVSEASQTDDQSWKDAITDAEDVVVHAATTHLETFAHDMVVLETTHAEIAHGSSIQQLREAIGDKVDKELAAMTVAELTTFLGWIGKTYVKPKSKSVAILRKALEAASD